MGVNINEEGFVTKKIPLSEITYDIADELSAADIHVFAERYLAERNINFEIEFVPQSKSRNKDEERPSLNWEGRFYKGGNFVRSEVPFKFSQGVGFVPNTPQNMWDQNGHRKLYEQEVAQTGRYIKTKLPTLSNGKIDWWACHNKRPGLTETNLPKPKMAEILWALIMDSDVLGYACFEDWADELGYNSDSRTAEKIYNDCLRTGLQLQALLGAEDLVQFRILFSQY